MKQKSLFNQIFLTFLVLTLIMQLLPLSSKYIKQVANIYSSKDWGLGYNSSSNPTGSDSPDLLMQYDAYYLDDKLKDNEKVLYLTFDMGYENGYTSKILDTLKEKNVPAAFFVVKHYIASQPDLVKRIVDEGHIIGNHSETHPKFSSLDDEKIKNQIINLEEAYKAITNKEMKKFFRPPSGNYSIHVLEEIQKLGYKTIFWSVAYADWDNKKQLAPKNAIDKIKSRIHNGAIILLHATSKTNSEILGQLIDDLKSTGYSFKSLDYLTSK